MLKANRKYSIGVDIGTTNLKAILFNDKLKVVADFSQHYNTYYNEYDYAEQEIDDVYQAFLNAIVYLTDKASNDGSYISNISFSSAMHSLILADYNKKAISRNIIWSDNRAKDEITNFKKNNDWLDFYTRSGTPIHPMSPFAKLLWFKNNKQLNDMQYLFGIKEYLIYKITGEYVMDYSIASSTGLMNIHKLQWDEKILEFLGIENEMLPKLVDVDQVLKISNKEFLAQTNVSEDTQLVVGASDGCLVNLGACALEKGKTTLTIGTSGAIRMTVDKPTLDNEGRTFCYYLKKDKWVIGGAVNNGGNVVEWLGRLLFDKSDELFKRIPNIINDIPCGSDGLFFMPYLHGERAPYWNANLQASFINIRPIHTKEYFVKATLEGVIMNLKNVWLILQEISGASSEIFVTGGLLSNENILPLVANIFGKELVFQKNLEHACLGATLIPNLDLYDVSESDQTLIFRPNLEKVESYKIIQNTFNEISNQITGNSN